MNSFLKKAGLGVALAATALTVAAPADAQYYGYRHHHDGGDAAAGAIVGGIIGLGLGAAIAGSNNNGYYNRGYYNDGYYRPRTYYRVQPRRYYNDYYNNYYEDDAYYQRCYNQWRFDPYYGRNVQVRVCN